MEPRKETQTENQGKNEFFGKKEGWATKDVALKGVLPKEQEEYGKAGRIVDDVGGMATKHSNAFPLTRLREPSYRKHHERYQ